MTIVRFDRGSSSSSSGAGAIAIGGADTSAASAGGADGYDIRMGGAPARLDSRLPEGTANLTILLLKPVKGNC